MAFVPIVGAWTSAIIGAILILATEGRWLCRADHCHSANRGKPDLSQGHIVVGCVVGRVGQDGALRARVRHCVRLRPGECAVAVHRGGKLGLGNALAVGDAAGRRPFNGRAAALRTVKLAVSSAAS